MLEINSTKLRIKGKSGGEMTFSLNRRWTTGSKMNAHPLIIDLYRTSRVNGFDVSKYTGNKGEIIEIKMIVDDWVMKTLILYIFSPSGRLIECGTLKSHRKSTNRLSAKYKTKAAHKFRAVKVVCCEVNRSQLQNYSTL